jgi:predicted DNA-binding transcriptional regulator YafY
MEYQNFAIDRIEKEEYSSKNLMGDSTFDAHSHFSHDIGNSVTKDTPMHKIKFKIEKKRTFCVNKKKWHHSQTNILELEDESSMTFTLDIIPNLEFWAKVMEHVEDIEILELKEMVFEFRERVRRVWERMLEI